MNSLMMMGIRGRSALGIRMAAVAGWRVVSCRRRRECEKHAWNLGLAERISRAVTKVCRVLVAFGERVVNSDVCGEFEVE